jgi:hypothetical protein
MKTVFTLLLLGNGIIIIASTFTFTPFDSQFKTYSPVFFNNQLSVSK